MINKTENWDDLLQSVVFSINTNKSATTGFSPFYLMYGRQPRLPFEVETLDKDITPTSEQIEDFKEKCKPYEETVVDHSAEMIKMQQEIFPQVMTNIEKAQEKQKKQYLKPKGIPDVKITDGDLVLRRNMLQKTKKGHKMQDHWLGPYLAANVDNEKGVCYLIDPKSGLHLKRQTPLKQLKIYQESSPSKPSNAPKTEAITPTHLSTTRTDPPATGIATGSKKPIPPSTTSINPPATGIATGSKKPIPPSTTSINPPATGIATGSKKPIPPSTTSINPPATGIATTTKSTTETTTEMQSDGHPEKHHEYNSVIEKLQIDDINLAVDSIHPELNKILNGEEISWYYELHTTGKCTSQPWLTKRDIPFNVYLGYFDDDQLEWITQKIVQNFSGIDIGVIFNILLPEAIIHISRDILDVSYDEANKYVKCSTCSRVKNIQPATRINHKRKNKTKHDSKKVKCSKKAKNNKTASQENTNIDNAEVQFLKSGKSTNNDSMKRPSFKLEKEDEAVITGNHMLTDKHITIAQNLLKKQFPHINGLMSTTLGPIGQFEVMQNKKFIQILHTGQTHWVCITNIDCAHGTIKVYDSLYKSLTPLTKKQIADILYCENDKIDVLVQPVVPQTNAVDCGVYAIAYAMSLCLGDDPCNIKLNRRTIRQHLWQCILTEKLTPFPSSKCSISGHPTKVQIRIFCSCRRPYEANQLMAECSRCSKWFHKDCGNIPEIVFKTKTIKWLCTSCTNL